MPELKFLLILYTHTLPLIIYPHFLFKYLIETLKAAISKKYCNLSTKTKFREFLKPWLLYHSACACWVGICVIRGDFFHPKALQALIRLGYNMKLVLFTPHGTTGEYFHPLFKISKLFIYALCLKLFQLFFIHSLTTVVFKLCRRHIKSPGAPVKCLSG